MKYLVNRETKEHKIYRFPDYVPPLWDLVDADPEGWIKHSGGECPLPDGWCALEFKYRPESVIYFTHKAELVDWSCVTLYRPIPDKKPEANPVPCAKAEESLIDRLKSAHKAASELPDIIAELREVLEPIGYDLVARDPFVEPEYQSDTQKLKVPPELQFTASCILCGSTKDDAHSIDCPNNKPEPDMTDWRNWREGDKIVRVSKPLYNVCTVGNIYKVLRVDEHEGQIWYLEDGGCEAYSEAHNNAFRFHSRPTKEQDK